MYSVQYIEYVEYITTSSQSFNNDSNVIATIQETTSKIVIEDCTDEISVRVNKVNSEKIVIEDETNDVTVIVRKRNIENDDENNVDIQE